MYSWLHPDISHFIHLNWYPKTSFLLVCLLCLSMNLFQYVRSLQYKCADSLRLLSLYLIKTTPHELNMR